MKKLEDITYRHELIERYLDADTSVEEEQALADFYRHCENKDLTDEDLDIRNLMLGMENYTPNFHQTEMEMMEELDGEEEMKELDRKEEADGQPQMKEMSLAASKNHETRWIRLSAILLATAMLAGLIFLLFPIKDYFSSSSEQPGLANLVPTEQVVRSQPSSKDEDGNLNAYEKMERVPGSNPGYRAPAGNEVKQDGTCKKKEYRRKKRERCWEDCRKYRRDLFWQYGEDFRKYGEDFKKK